MIQGGWFYVYHLINKINMLSGVYVFKDTVYLGSVYVIIYYADLFYIFFVKIFIWSTFLQFIL
jgi:hypothetical protein